MMRPNQHRTTTRHRRGAALGREARPRAFTLVELLVSITLLVVVIATLSQVFSISSDTTSRTAANIEIIASSAAFREAVTNGVTKMAPGLLIIESPPPTSPRQEVRGGPRFVPLHHHRLVFMVQGDVGEYQSFIDPTRGTAADPTPRTAASSQALVYFGPGTPLSRNMVPPRPHALDDDSDPLSVSLTASEWVFLHRSILLMLDADASWTPTPPNMDVLTATGGMLDGGSLDGRFRDGGMDAIVSNQGDTFQANTETVANLILQRLRVGGLLVNTQSIAALWEPSAAPRTATLVSTSNDYYLKSGANFIPHMADFRIEWTDGRRIDPANGDFRTRWFGLVPDPAFDVNDSFLDNVHTDQVPNIARRRQDVVSYGGGAFADSNQEEVDVFRDKIEFSSIVGPDIDADYRAIWLGDTWQYRPKALRFTYRIYDEGNRLKHTAEVDLDEDGIQDPDGNVSRRIFTRYGRQFSIVVAVP